MPNNVIIFIFAILTLGGCETHEPGASQLAVPSPPPATPPETETTQTKSEDSAKADRITAMYTGYKAEAFANTPDFTVADLQVLESDQPVTLVDCREDAERAVSMIPGAITTAQFEAIPEDYRGHLVVMYCTVGYRSGVYAKDLIERDFDAINLIGGVLAWAHEGNTFIDPDGNRTQRVHVYGPTWDLLPSGYESVQGGVPSP